MDLLDSLLNIFEVFSPGWSREGWLLLSSLLFLLRVFFLLDWFAILVERFRRWVLSDGIVQQELQRFTSYNTVIHLATETVRSF